MNNLFRRFAERTATLAGTPAAFLLAVSAVLAWLITGPLFGFSDTWQLVINTGTGTCLGAVAFVHNLAPVTFLRHLSSVISLVLEIIQLRTVRRAPVL